MGLARIHIATFLLALGLCNAETTGSREIKVNDFDSVEHSIIDDTADISDESEEKEQDSDEDILPVLPPIILLDFDNGTIDDNATTDEKSKRTVNNNLGYGFDRNSLHSPRKYNYYFPAGKTGTTVSIEESISPFLPRTIIEKVPGSNQKSVSGLFANLRQQGLYRTGTSAGSNIQSSSNFHSYDPAKSLPIFGLRTRLIKTSNTEPYQGSSPTARPSVENYSNVDYREGAYVSTTPQSLVFSQTESAGYVTPSPQSFTASSSDRYTYITSSSPSYAEEQSQRYLGQSSQSAINVQSYSGRPAQNMAESSTSNPLDAATFLENIGVQSRVNSHDYVRSGSNAVESSTSGPGDASGYVQSAGPFSNLPRFTVENGVRYENKIFWKYPDGRVSDVPPMTYETYSEYPSLAALQAAKSRDTSQIYESGSTENSVLSQGPVQFPMAPESGRPSTSFISADSLSTLPQQHAYRLSYQNLVSPKQIAPQQIKAGSGVSSAYSVSSTTSSPPRSSFKSSGKSPINRYESIRRPISKYMVNSPNPEYLNSYTTESAPRSTTPPRSFAPSAGRNSAKKTNGGVKNLENYSNLQYTDLLNYNPSISQYIKNPASLLNVQPTFVQAGNSLIPVIILRVDGVPPIQPKASPNVNLKALLQQYLVQYARSIEELARPSNYDLGSDQFTKDQSSFSTNPLRELARLAQNGGGRDLIGNPTGSYIGQTSYETSQLDIEEGLSSRKYGERTAARPKVKSVQILDDPRFPNYRIKN